MKVPMGPPPPKNRNPNPNPNLTSNPDHEPSTATQSVAGEEKDTTIATQSVAGEEKTTTSDTQIIAGEEKTTTSDTQIIAGEENLTDQDEAQDEEKISNPNPNHAPSKPQNAGITIPYSIPPWSHPPSHPFFFEVLKDGAIIEQLDVSEKGAYMFGRVNLCDFVLEHPTISRFHAVLQYKKDEVFLYDLGSTHGTSINKRQVKSENYTEVHVGDVIRFGQSSRLYVFQGPSELMPPEAELEKIRKSKMLREEMNDRIASLARAKVEASLADGISWGMDEDAPEEAPEDEADEVTWQTYRGQLTERQEKTRGKILKRMEKVANMKKEIDAIRVKDISQGGLTQGQQTQIARNEQRMSQIMEELESLEETLNESIQESIGARSGKVVLGKKKGYVEEEDDILSDEDDFFDRTKKQPTAKKYGKQQAVETADSLLDKKELIVNEMEEKKALLIKEKDKVGTTSESSSEGGDDLDAYMIALSSQLVVDKTVKIQKELSELQSELDRIIYLLKIADPMGDASKKREVKVQAPKLSQPLLDMRKQPQSKQKKPALDEKSVKSVTESNKDEKTVSPEEVEIGSEIKENKPVTYTVTKPQWLGAKMDTKLEEDQAQGVKVDMAEPNKDDFVDYKDRKKVLASVDNGQELENAAPGLIIRKRKSEDKAGETVDKAAKLVATSSSSPVEAEATAADAVALLLKHKRGYVAFDDEIKDGSRETHTKSVSSKESSQPKRVFGPQRPDFLEKGPDYESWVPPEGQTGDGRTSLNDRLGY